jgi:hypothetical protein
MNQPDRSLIDFLVEKCDGSVTKAAVVLGVTYHRLNNWRERGVPATYRPKFWTTVNLYGAGVPSAWLDVSKPSNTTNPKGKTNGRKSPSKRAQKAFGKVKGKAKRPRPQQRRRRRPVGRSQAALA